MKNQTIKRSDLKIIYNNVCQDWQNTIKDLLLWQEGSSIEISEELVQKGYNQADSEQKKLIEKYFKISTPKSIIDKIKTFDDVLETANLTLTEVIPWKHTKTKRQRFQNAVAKIQLIAEVLNEGWEAKFGIGQNNYYPWFEKKASGGWVCGDYGCDFGSGGVVAYFKNAELAKYAGTQFIAEYKQLLDNY